MSSDTSEASENEVPLYAAFCTAELSSETLTHFVEQCAQAMADWPEDIRPRVCLLIEGTKSFLDYDGPTSTRVSASHSAYLGKTVPELVRVFEHMTNQDDDDDDFDEDAIGQRAYGSFMILDGQTAVDRSCICVDTIDGGQTLRAEPTLAMEVLNAIEVGQQSLHEGIYAAFVARGETLTAAGWAAEQQGWTDAETESQKHPKEVSSVD